MSEANAAALWGLLGTAWCVGVHRLDDALGASREALARAVVLKDDAARARIFHQAAYVALNHGDFAAAKDHALAALADAERAELCGLAAPRAQRSVQRRDLRRRRRGGGARLLGAAGRVRPPLRQHDAPLYATFGLIELAVDAGDVAALERLDAELRELQVLLTPTASESLLPAQALRAAWDGRFEHAYVLLAPSADKQFDDDRRALRYAECAVYAAAAGMRAESTVAVRRRADRAAGARPPDRLALRARANLAIAETLLGRDARAAATIAALRAGARGAGPRVAALIDAIVALRQRWSGRLVRPGVARRALDRLEAVELGGISRFIAALLLPAATAAPARMS